MAQAFLFDLDGTLVDSEPIWALALGRSLSEMSCAMGEREVEELVYGRSWLDIYADLCRLFPGRCEDRAAIERRIDRHFGVLRRTRDVRIDGSIELLIRLARQRPVAVVSGSSRRMVDEWIEELDLRSHIRFFLGCEDYPVGKPDPACYRMAADRLGIAPADCVVFEDSRAGVLAAKAAGMMCVALQRGGVGAQDLSAADLLVPNLAGLDSTLVQMTPRQVPSPAER